MMRLRFQGRAFLEWKSPGSRTIFVVACCAAIFVVATVWSQVASDPPGMTQDHVAAPGWWPTKRTGVDGRFAGDGSCAKCHVEESSRQAGGAMARAAFRHSGTTQPGSPVPGSVRSGPYLYELVQAAQGLEMRVTSDDQSLSSRIEWTFGAGVHGKTYLLQEHGDLYESQVSSFSLTHHMDLTPGHREALEGSLLNALGRRLSRQESAQCFACHTTQMPGSGRLDIANAQPGVHCEACHGPSKDHVDAALEGKLDKTHGSVFDPGSLTPAKSIDFCGACHKTAMDVAMSGIPQGVSGIRFQPYRLQKSRCWEKTQDERLTCVACHDPHEPLVRDVSFYDRKCLTCHSSGAGNAHPSTQQTSVPPVCPKATANCTHCHMPKYDVPEMHSEFTDHFIRVVRPGESYPH